MNNEPVAWAIKLDGDFTEIGFDDDDLENIELWYAEQGWSYEYVPLYNHPHPDNLGLALSIIDQQKIEIEALKLLLKRNQEPLGEKFEKVLKDNLWQLYEDSNK